jgi:hypothetical protein
MNNPRALYARRSSIASAYRALVAGAIIITVAGGLRAEEHATPWSIQALQISKPPHREAGTWGHNAIDAFIAEGHRERGVTAAPPANRRTLIRRASYDLTGLPPSDGPIEAFVADPRPDPEAFREITEKLLASSHYGEHWGRHWLDVVRYADTAGENSDHPLPHAWRYRNWVIDAFNNDKPYDQFVRDQLAGDLMAENKPTEERMAGIVATGYLAIARRFGHDIDKGNYLMYEDAIENLGKAFLGLTISCARCHDHKHDPIGMRDYYALYAVLESTKFSFPGCEPKQQPRDLISLAPGDFASRRKTWEKRRDELKAEADATGPPAKSKKLKELATKCSVVVSKGDVPDGGSVVVSEQPIAFEVRKGEAIQLSILPRGNHGADTTILDLAITHTSGGETTRWPLADLIDDLLKSNPKSAAKGAAWCFLDTAGDPKFLTTRNHGVDGKKELKSWSPGELPSVLVNTSSEPVKAWYTLPPRTFFCHPSAKGPVAIAWLSPVNGRVTIDLTVSDGHPGGDGVAWQLEHFADPAIAAAYRDLGEASRPRLGLEEEIANHVAAEPVAPLAYAVAEGAPKPARLQERGDPELPGEAIPTEFLAILGGGTLGGGKTSGRLELAEKIASRDNPLTARVMVNRIWAWHFGHGLVATRNDFGNHGTPPSHPELLDYLARYFMDHGWSVKAMHRLIMESATYRQAARDGFPPESFSAFARRRITAEELRDTILVAAGTLDLNPGNEHPFPPTNKWSFTQHAPFAAEYLTAKRSVYVMRKRNRASRFFALFNGADPNASTADRDVTTVPTQALYFMNDPFFHNCAEKFAERIRAAASDPASRLDFAFREVFARPVTDGEVTNFTDFATTLDATLKGDAEAREKATWNAYARVLLGCNELLHLD